MSDELAVPNDDIDERLEKAIWKSLGKKSARRIAEETGLSPERVLRAKREMLEAVDELTIQEKRQKLLVDLQEVADKARDLADVAIQEFQAGLLNSAIQAIKAMQGEMARLDKADTSKIEALNDLRVKELMSLMAAVVDEGVREISDNYGLDQDELFEVFNRKLVDEAHKRDLT